MIEFPTIRSGLAYVVDNLVSHGLGYIVNIERIDTRHQLIQVVAQGMIEFNNENGLSVHLPFDIDSGQHKYLLRFFELDLSVEVKQQDFGNIPCFYANFGTDYEYANRVILLLLVQLYKCSPSEKFMCEVYDEGPLDRVETHQAPPGGVIV